MPNICSRLGAFVLSRAILSRGECSYPDRRLFFFCGLLLSNRQKKKLSVYSHPTYSNRDMQQETMQIDINTTLDVQHPLTVSLMLLAVANAVMKIAWPSTTEANRPLSVHFRDVASHVLYMLFAVYVIGCYRNGNCNALAAALSWLLILTEICTLVSSVHSDI